MLEWKQGTDRESKEGRVLEMSVCVCVCGGFNHHLSLHGHTDMKGSESFMSVRQPAIRSYRWKTHPGIFSPPGNLQILIKTRHKAGMKEKKARWWWCIVGDRAVISKTEEWFSAVWTSSWWDIREEATHSLPHWTSTRSRSLVPWFLNLGVIQSVFLLLSLRSANLSAGPFSGFS